MVIASEAIFYSIGGDCFVAALLAVTSELFLGGVLCRSNLRGSTPKMASLESARDDYFSSGYAFFLAGSKNGVLTIFAGA